MSQTLTEARKQAWAKLVNAARWPDRQDVAQARANYAAARIAELVDRELAKAPPLSAEQLDKIAAVLNPAGN